MPIDPTCDALNDQINAMGVCWPDARQTIINALNVIYEFLNCGSSPCSGGNQPCVKKVPESTPVTAFISVGWGTIPDAITCPYLIVLRGCEIWMGVNSPACRLAFGEGWCNVCGDPFGGIVRAQVRGNAGLTQSITNALVTRKFSAIEFNEGVSMALIESGGVGTGYDGISLLLPGTYWIDMNLNTQSTQSDSPTNLRIICELWNLTTNTMLKRLPLQEFSGNAPGLVPFHHQARQRVVIGAANTYAIKMNGNPGVGITSNITLGDEIYIEKTG